jgi:serine/threonine protein kinase
MDAASLVGNTLGPYHVQELIGRGASSVVYRAEDVVRERSVALKVLATRDSERPEQLGEESRCLERCRSPHVVATYGAGRSGDIDFLALELMQGTLEARIADAPLRPDEVIAIGAAILAGLEVAHRRGVLHCDIKPSNVGIAADGTIKLLDFGIAWPLFESPLAGSRASGRLQRGLVGTPHYMPPEQIRDEPLDERTDIYSVGAVLYELLTGRKPLTAHSLFTLIETVLHNAPARPSLWNPDVDPGLEGVVMAALAKAPAGRYPSARAMAEALVRTKSARYAPLLGAGLGGGAESASW